MSKWQRWCSKHSWETSRDLPVLIGMLAYTGGFVGGLWYLSFRVYCR